jgi:hypothetical protein
LCLENHTLHHPDIHGFLDKPWRLPDGVGDNARSGAASDAEAGTEGVRQLEPVTLASLCFLWSSLSSMANLTFPPDTACWLSQTRDGMTSFVDATAHCPGGGGHQAAITQAMVDFLNISDPTIYWQAYCIVLFCDCG